MRRLCFFLFTFLWCLSTHAQEVNIFGKVVDITGQPLPGATVKYENRKGTIADANGNFQITTNEKESVSLKIRFIGYKTIDTLVTFSNRTDIFLRIEMTQELFELPDIEITADYQNIFEDYRPFIIDFTINNDFFYLITKTGQKSFLNKANLNGTILEKHELKGGYNRFYNSCLGGVILVGNEICAEMHDLDDKLFITNEFSIDYFDKYIVPCKFKKNGFLLFKNISVHNKKIDYIRFGRDQDPYILYTVFDHEGAKVSQSYFSELIRAYYKETGSASLDDIDYGFERENVIDDGSWSGDLQDLITTNLTHKLVLQYQALGLKEVSSELFVMDNTPYILDQFSEKVLKIDENLTHSQPVGNLKLNEDFKIITDNASKTYFQIDDTLYELNIENPNCSLTPVLEMPHYYFNERSLIHKGTLYRLGRKSINTVRKKIFRTALY
ncbi:MAG: carboxypeptidase-like regulatory domain-containing protein [Bacteroidota bacterium]